MLLSKLDSNGKTYLNDDIGYSYQIVFQMYTKIAKNMYNRYFQFNFFYHRVATNEFFFKINISDSDKCSYGNKRKVYTMSCADRMPNIKLTTERS